MFKIATWSTRFNWRSRRSSLVDFCGNIICCMDADEREICDFLKSFPGQYISGREIARRAAGKWKFLDDQNWAVPVLIRLKEQGIVEVNASGQYRLTGQLQKEKKKKKWIAP